MAGGEYYSDKLSADRLGRVYDIAPPRVRRYLEAEIDHVLSRTAPGERVLELGCGYGRVLKRLAGKAGEIVGIDISPANIEYAKQHLAGFENINLHLMNALSMDFADAGFDVVVCIQNGISAFGVEPAALVKESLRVTRPGGVGLFSSYSDAFWDERLRWFELQAEEGLLGEIDREHTGNGIIVCKDGFRATTFRADDFARIATALGIKAHIEEVDESSLFCEFSKQ